MLVQVYVAEISPPRYRGAFISLNGLMLTVGLFIAQLVGVYISYYWLANITLGFTAIFILFAVTTKETPQWLVIHGRILEAVKTLRWLNGPDCNVGEEIKKITDGYASQKLTLLDIIKQFRNKSVYHPVILACVIMSFVQLSGITAVVFNVEDIFKQAKVKSPGLTSSLATGGVQIVASFVGIFIVSLLGRRKLLMISYGIASLSHAVMGVYEYLNNEPYCHPPDDPQCRSDLYPLAIVCVALFIASYAGGIAAVSYMFQAELIPFHVRGVGIGLSSVVSGIVSTIIAGLFNSYEILVKPWGAFWTFSLTCFIAVLFVAVFIPETKGKSLEEIENMFDSRSLRQRHH